MDKDRVETMLFDQAKSLERIETNIKHLPTKEDISAAIDKHKDSCTRYKRPTIAPGAIKPSKAAITIGSLLTGAGAVIGYLLQYFLN